MFSEIVHKGCLGNPSFGWRPLVTDLAGAALSDTADGKTLQYTHYDAGQCYVHQELRFVLVEMNGIQSILIGTSLALDPLELLSPQQVNAIITDGFRFAIKLYSRFPELPMRSSSSLTAGAKSP